MQPIQLGLIGCGTVGAGVARLLLEGQSILEKRVAAPLQVKYVADLDTQTDRGVAFPAGVFISDAWQVINDPDIDIVIEMIGGETLAKDIILAALEKGKHVVTANKALLAKHGNEIIAAALANQTDLAYEASVGGCMPIIKTLREALVGNEISAMTGILNGTCNYILSKITETGMPFKNALTEAQAKGYAEADPTLDVEGLDAAHKLAILTALAYGMHINFDDIYTEGISAITPQDIQFAAEFGYCIKLLAISKLKQGAVEARVHPTMIPQDNILSSVSGTLNAITVSGHAVGNLFLSGHGAGMMPTASAVVSDLADIARNLVAGRAGRIPVMGFQPDTIRRICPIKSSPFP
jgi:homoserine dehydrogenase